MCNTMFYRTLIFLISTTVIVVFGKDTRVAGGREVSAREFPYLVSIKHISDNTHICGGAIISEQHVLTSGECIDDEIVDTDDIIVRAGMLIDGFINEYIAGYEFYVEDTYLHPDYQKTLSATIFYHNNIGIIKIATRFEFNYALSAIDLADSEIVIGKIGTLSGWGKKVHPVDPNPRRVRKAWMMVVSSINCQNDLDIRILRDQFCAFQSRGVGACIGDTGSPLVIDDKLVGVVSLFEPCGTGVPDVYTSVFNHLQFIYSIIHL